jgi:translation initiation factor 4E
LSTASPTYHVHLFQFFIEWVLWEHAGGTNKDPNKWKENMKELCSFKTVEGFWQYFNHLPRPSEVFFDGESRKKIGVEGKTIEEYSLFKKGIEPEWTDPENVKGGEWFCRQFFESDVLDLYWQNLIMGIIGEAIDAGIEGGNDLSYVNGVRIMDKGKGYQMFKIELWLNTRDPVIKEALRERLLEIITEGQPPSRKGHPKFDWKDHSS